MSKIERLHLLGWPVRQNHRGGEGIQPAGAAYARIVEYLCLSALFVGWAGFWATVIWWIFR